MREGHTSQPTLFPEKLPYFDLFPAAIPYCYFPKNIPHFLYLKSWSLNSCVFADCVWYKNGMQRSITSLQLVCLHEQTLEHAYFSLNENNITAS